MCLIFVGQGYPRKLFNLEHFPIYGMSKLILLLRILLALIQKKMQLVKLLIIILTII